MSLTIFTFLLLAASCLAAPASNDDTVTINEEFFPKEMLVYSSEHEIVNIFVPVNEMNFKDESSETEGDSDIILFFVEADLKANGEKDYKGMYVLQNHKATKILENGVDAAAAKDNSTEIFIAANDGVYVYNIEDKKSVRYGSVSDNVIGIAVENSTGVMYILNAKHELYKVTDEGTKQVKVSDVQNAQEFVLDWSNNLYFYGLDKQPMVVSTNGIKKIDGLPENPTNVKLIRPPFVIDDGVPFVSDDRVFIIYANGTSQFSDFKLQVKPSAYGLDATLVQYYGYNKGIYEYNILSLILGTILESIQDEIKNKVEAFGGEVRSLASRSMNDIRA